MSWNHRQFGTEADPIRQSALNAIASQEGCGKRYFLEREAESEGRVLPERFGWRMCIGTAVHAVLERALTKTGDHVLAGKLPSRALVASVLEEELVRATRTAEEIAANKPGDATRINWRDDKPEVEKAEGVTMVLGALSTIAQRASEIVAVEAKFITKIDDYFVEGTIDLAYRERETGELALCDWKTGQRHVPRVVLDHGYQVGIYMHALEHGTLWPGTDRARCMGVAPTGGVQIVHLRDFVGYDRAATILQSLRTDGPAIAKVVADRIHHRYPASPQSAAGIMGALCKLGLTNKVRKGKSVEWFATPNTDRMPPIGDIWYRSERRSEDVARLKVSLKTVVGTVRLGRAVERLGEQCSRCPFSGPCLGEGYVTKADQSALAAALEGVDGDGLGELSTNEAA